MFAPGDWVKTSCNFEADELNNVIELQARVVRALNHRQYQVEKLIGGAIETDYYFEWEMTALPCAEIDFPAWSLARMKL